VCRFYSYTLDEVRELTIQEFKMMSLNIVEITKIENPQPESEKAKPLSSANLSGIMKKPKKGK
jgi:hypothetical protein